MRTLVCLTTEKAHLTGVKIKSVMVLSVDYINRKWRSGISFQSKHLSDGMLKQSTTFLKNNLVFNQSFSTCLPSRGGNREICGDFFFSTSLSAVSEL